MTTRPNPTTGSGRSAGGETSRTLRRRFWLETMSAGLSVAVLLLTLTWSDWIELLLHVDPDHGSGALEWAIVIMAAASAAALLLAAGREWKGSTRGAGLARPVAGGC